MSVSIAIEGGANPCPCSGLDEPVSIDTALVSAIKLDRFGYLYWRKKED